jgi:two-component system LytT family sensor kinase
MNSLLNALGLTIGLALYAMLLAMVAANRDPRKGLDPVALATAVLGLTWNMAAVVVYGLPGRAPEWVAVCAFSALGFLPAVVVHSVLRGNPATATRSRAVLRVLAYGASSLAAMLQIEAAVAGHTIPSVFGFRLLTIFFIGMLPLLAVLTRAQPGSRRALWGVALAAFAVSALHLSQYNETAAWPIELVGHNASIPLAVAILYQDYPFAFADLFVKRALTLIGVVGAMGGALWITGIGFGPAVVTPLQVGTLLVLSVAAALATPGIASVASWFVDSIVLTRPNYRTSDIELTRRLHDAGTIPAVLDELCSHLANMLSAAEVRWYEDERGVPSLSTLVTVDAGRRAEVRVPTAEGPRYVIDVDALRGGRRILSDDVTMLTAAAMNTARRIDAVRLEHERFAQHSREREVAQLATEAELRALRAQLNPHFFFNALTTIGYLIQTAPDRALDTLLRLTTLLRAVLRSEGEFTTLGRELDLIDAYLSIERARFEDRLHVQVDVSRECRDVQVPSLLIQPLVENAIKHGIAPIRTGGRLDISAQLEGADEHRRLIVSVKDVTPADGPRRREWTRGVGLTSVERRLQGHFGRDAVLEIITDVPGETVVLVSLPVPPAVAQPIAARGVR